MTPAVTALNELKKQLSKDRSEKRAQPTALVMTRETLEAIKQAAEGAKNQFAMGAIPYAMIRVYGIPFETYDSREECLQRIAAAKLNERLQLVEIESVNEAAES